ncbi:MAG TPA: PAS domain S-box protein [Candidatus Udaeobacter sp.]|nr:PAS domain S-box protein [Candidatus Udaeobacter sp.]
MAISDRQRLRQSEARFRALVDAATDYAIFLLDESGFVTTWNPGAERMKGYQEDEIVDRHFSIFYPPEDVTSGKPERSLEAALRDGRFEDEGWRVRKDGSRFMANVVITPVRDSDGELLGYAKVTRDITERKREQERAARVRASDERQQIAVHIHRTAISLLFEVGMELQGLAVRSKEVETRKRLEASVSKLDDAIRQLRSFVFHPEGETGG